MNRIVAKKQLSAQVYEMEVEAPLIAASHKAGQFLIVQIDTIWGERIPLTIADANLETGTITLVFQTVGSTTLRLAAKEPGEFIENILGPLGNPTHVEKLGTVVCVGGGIGVAPLFPIVEAMKKAGNIVKVVIGARTKELVIFEDRMKRYADELVVVTDDGSYGRKAVVTVPLEEFSMATPKPALSVAIGPPIMMKFCEKTAAKCDVPIMVSLNTIMIDGTGMCGGCRVTVGGETKFVCVDGPEFDGHKVDFDNMMLRMRSYRTREEADHHKCRLELGLPPLPPPPPPPAPAGGTK
ncbi:MAG: sulfide/dihydroorotate dehydrogenase-like FAD/NAD-binding protein [Treponema sp.]|jgi:ferredoxin--NADP+ reductase|nr:sulfide/dihydroorotate dehydrogenase-like FAD/NAD-binding protein [Treponema sp.]